MPGPTKSLPAQKLLLQLLDYDPETGLLTWRPRPVEMFNSTKFSKQANASRWNTRNAGKPAFSSDNGLGYRVGAIYGSNFLAHRVIWKMMTGEDPQHIDHIDGDPGNNQWSNLRSVSRSTNMRNAARPGTNKSGRVGVRRAKERWSAHIKMLGKNISLGHYDTFEEACAARLAAEKANGFHENHGRLKTSLT